MTDIDIGVDPALDAHLRRTLREVASTLPDRATSDNVVRLVTVPTRSDRGRRWAWLGAAAAAGVVAGAGLTAVADRDSDHTTVPAATTAPLAGPDPDMFGLANGCAAAHGRNALDESMNAVVFAPTGSAPNGIVLVSVDDVFFTCGVSSDGDAMLTDHSFVGQIWGNPPRGEAVQVLEVRADTSRSALVGPGRILIIGRAGAAVDGIDVALPDGATSAAQLVGGWFVADAQVPPDVPMMAARLNWHTRSGATLTSRVDLLDDETDAEACARERGCVDAALAQLLNEARDAGRSEQAAILADGEVTNSERVASLTRFADCFNAANTGATATVSGPGGVRIGTSNLQDRDATERALDVDALCRAAHTVFVDDAWLLLDTQRRVAQR